MFLNTVIYHEKKEIERVERMPVRNRSLQIVGGLITLIFGSLYLSFWFASVFYYGIQPWSDDIFLFFLDIFFGVLFIIGLALILIGTIIPDFPLIIYTGSLFTIFFGTAGAFASPGLHLPPNPLDYSWLFMLITVITSIIYIVAGYQPYSLTKQGVTKLLHNLPSKN
jgi:vacuolar-type H+-ATPase subunit I/STV1